MQEDEMNIHLHIEPAHEGLDVHVYTAQYDERVEMLMKGLKQQRATTVVGYIEEDIHLIKIEEVFSIFVEEAKVFIQTEEEEYRAKLKLYELEEQFEKQLIRVNKSTLVQINHIQSLQLKALGTTQVVLSNDVEIPISRKFLKPLKEKLGIGRGAQ